MYTCSPDRTVNGISGYNVMRGGPNAMNRVVVLISQHLFYSNNVIYMNTHRRRQVLLLQEDNLHAIHELYIHKHQLHRAVYNR